MIERAYRLGEALGLAVWGTDEAGPYTTTPYPGTSWQLEQHPKHYPHEYPRNGTAKLLTVCHPATGRVRVKGVTSASNPVLHDCLKTEVTTILDTLPEPTPVSDEQTNRAFWESWRAGVSVKPTLLSAPLPPLRMLLILDNLAGHPTPSSFCGCSGMGFCRSTRPWDLTTVKPWVAPG